MSGIQQMLMGGGPLVSMTFLAPTSVVTGPTATASFSLASDGDIDATAINNSIADAGDWIAPKSGMSDWEVRATLTSGTALSTGTMGTFLNLGTTRTWTLAAAPVNDFTSNVLFEFRRSGSTAIVNSQTVVFHAVSS